MAWRTGLRAHAVWICVFVATGVAASAGPVSAQTSRAAVIAARQAEKARNLRRYVPNRAEQIIVGLQEKFLLQPGGFYPVFGSVYSGGGFTLGGGYRHFVGERAMWNVHGLYSLSNYKLVETGLLSPGHARGRVDFGARFGWRDATQVAFYGLGMDTSPDARTNFRFNQTYGGAAATVRPAFPVVLEGAFTFEDYTLKPGQGSYPSIEDVHTGATAPGLGANPTYLHSEVAAGIDWRTSPGYSRKGGFYGLRWHDYADTDETYSFHRLDVDLVQHIPIRRETWVISLRGAVQTTLGDEDNVPYFLLPSLGSGSTLRAYPSWRFRDRHSLLTSAEWRWIPNRLFLDMAIFYDAGEVTASRGDLDFDGLKHNWGLGVRFHGPMSTPLRIEMAKGSEGWHLVFAGSAAF